MDTKILWLVARADDWLHTHLDQRRPWWTCRVRKALDRRWARRHYA